MKQAIVTGVLALAVAAPAWAQSGHGSHGGSPAATAKQSPLADGEIRRVDKEGKKLTIKHGPIPSIDMPPMTMAFGVRDPKMLDQVKAGDKIKFQAEMVGQNPVVTRIEAAK